MCTSTSQYTSCHLFLAFLLEKPAAQFSFISVLSLLAGDFCSIFFSFFFVFNFFVCCNVFYTSKVRLSIVKRTWENMAWLEQSMGPWEKNTLRITYITVTAGVDKHNFVLGKQNDFLAFSEKNWKC